MTGRHRAAAPLRDPAVPLITAGDPDFGRWCPVCRDASRVRVPLLAGGRPAGGIEFCPGCGTGHDKPGVYVFQAPPPDPARTALLPGPRGPLIPYLARLAHARACRRAGTMPLECAYRDCRWPGRHKLTVRVDGEDGTWRYVFCRKAHRDKWQAENPLAGA